MLFAIALKWLIENNELNIVSYNELKKGSDFIFELLPFSDINFLALLYLSSTLLTT